MNGKNIVAKEVRVLCLRGDCYELTVRITDGPENMIDRLVKVQLSSDQLNKIAKWEPIDNTQPLYLD